MRLGRARVDRGGTSFVGVTMSFAALIDGTTVTNVETVVIE